MPKIKVLEAKIEANRVPKAHFSPKPLPDRKKDLLNNIEIAFWSDFVRKREAQKKTFRHLGFFGTSLGCQKSSKMRVFRAFFSERVFPPLLASFWEAPTLENRAPVQAPALFPPNRVFQKNINFASILVPFWEAFW